MRGRRLPAPIEEEAFDLYRRFDAKTACQFLTVNGYPTLPGAFESLRRRRGFISGRIGGPRGSHQWDDTELAILADYYSDPTVRPRDLEQLLKLPWHIIQAKAQRLGYKRNAPASPFHTIITPHLDISDGLLVIADLHVPFQDARWIDRYVALAESWQIRRALLLGDSIDGQSLSHFEVFDQPTFAQEQEEWAKTEEFLLARFAELVMTMGNHEARAGKAGGHKFGPLGTFIRNNFVQNKTRVTVHDTFQIRASHGDELWHLEHPKMHGATTAADMCSTYSCHVGIAHLHAAHERMDRSGKYHGVTIGASADHARMPYCSRITHGKWQMTQGAMILKVGMDGQLHHFNLRPDMDLEGMRRMYAPYRSTVRPIRVVRELGNAQE